MCASQQQRRQLQPFLPPYCNPHTLLLCPLHFLLPDTPQVCGVAEEAAAAAMSEEEIDVDSVVQGLISAVKVRGISGTVTAKGWSLVQLPPPLFPATTWWQRRPFKNVAVHGCFLCFINIQWGFPLMYWL